MKQALYKNYADDIAHMLRTGSKGKNKSNMTLSKGLSGPVMDTSPTMNWLNENKREANFRSLSALNSITGTEVRYAEKLGSHPSFSHLKSTNNSEYHYIVTMFVDIKNSTGLFKKYDPDVVANICRVIQMAAIHTCWYFDGYIHRLQGDGLMVYFGGRNVTKQKAVDNSLMAASFISYFMENDLRNMFDEQGVKRIYSRIGIDFGDDEDTLWHNAGIGECSEVTTTGLHTSLPCKMQGQAVSNGVVVGDNIINYKTSHADYFKHLTYKSDGEESDYIYQEPENRFYYKQHEFNWRRYLKNHPSIEESEDGELKFKDVILPASTNVLNNMSQLQQNATGYKPYFTDK
ncbi:hypothetical protein [Flavobacterium sp. TBRC 19031]|uniref:hypothetical protein n=1 Tax=Flavobacterium mekongense TaxID=3379707 RepID=UPI00399B7FA5